MFSFIFQSLLTHVSRPTKNILNKLGVFTVSSFHAFICARSPSLLNNLLAGRGATKRRPPLLSRSNSGSSRRSMQVSAGANATQIYLQFMTNFPVENTHTQRERKLCSESAININHECGTKSINIFDVLCHRFYFLLWLRKHESFLLNLSCQLILFLYFYHLVINFTFYKRSIFHLENFHGLWEPQESNPTL